MDARPQPARLARLTLAALGVVFGDIGTSPLYALRECFAGVHAIPVTAANVLGVLSLVFWSLIITVTVKYLLFVMRADNNGEGGILALVALVRRSVPDVHRHGWAIAVGLFGAALLYGDGMITPAISVLSAVEGLGVATHAFEPVIVPITVVILVLLFLVQHRGTGRIGDVFGPIMIVWFAIIGLIGLSPIADHPAVLSAVSPVHAARFFAAHGAGALLTLGAVFLSVTGAEALYADMGHFGRAPIRIAWFSLVLPALVINYFGQGARLLENPGARENPFFALAPSWALLPLVVLATVAAVIASQAIISGAFSLTQQAMQLGYSPRLNIHHTSAHEKGQVYIPEINILLLVTTVALVLVFRTSTNLAAAYGMAVTSTMVITTLLAYLVARQDWGWGVWRAASVTAAFLVIDLAFFGANLAKIAHGGWFPLAVAGVIYTLMATWAEGRRLVQARLNASVRPLEELVERLRDHPPIRVPGTGIFMTAHDGGVPPILIHHLEHNKALHEQVVLLTVRTLEVPEVPARDAVHVEEVGYGLFRMVACYGFMQSPDVPAAIAAARAHGLTTQTGDTTYYLAHLTLFANDRIGMSAWRDHLFILMSRNARRATNFFSIPPNSVVELGIQLEL
ncbi:MAG TPA: potassium transporter Kup [Vicinamibacterales bacterium]|nr:potassium transporter Kup [Vicinamibacterales bacterium]